MNNGIFIYDEEFKKNKKLGVSTVKEILNKLGINRVPKPAKGSKTADFNSGEYCVIKNLNAEQLYIVYTKIREMQSLSGGSINNVRLNL